VADSGNGNLYRVDPVSGLSRLLSEEAQKPVQMVCDKNNVYVLDKGIKAVLRFDFEGNLTNTIDTLDTIALHDRRFIEMTAQAGTFFIIDMNKSERILYRYSVTEDSVRIIYRGEGLRTVREETSGNILWVSQNNEQGAKLVQLSADGLRLNILNGFKYIRDFRINTYNGALLVGDAGRKELIHIRPDGSIIGKYPQTINPLKVYCQ